ncbi:LOW QUALITY PROTEIN: uncharacterized protein LOC110181176 [Drosophila serrata]|uniref:LOW QUALITY PROTEIN: uncharacterized protein LOC110181176 n=1 Tax=Drosophila serrata TaxID=7274 RepID=UPI000A1CFEB1|nr:LOW QUALITY PROTEIN: uncharacterized protein LOC110181176 [Drosophila serrata]
MVVGLIVRAGVVYAIILVTKKYGVWDSPDVAQEVYADAAEHIEPYADKARRQLNICPPRPPPQGEWSFFGIHYYNKLVKAFFDVLSLLPYGMALVLENAPGYFTAMYEYIRKLLPDGEKKKKEITISKGQLDETPLVRPHCQDKNCPKKPPLIPPPCPKCKSDNFIYEPRIPKNPRCECSKCKERPREKWSENECTRNLIPKKSKCACGEPVYQEPNKSSKKN